MANSFVGTSQFNLPDRILKQFRRDAFLRGGVTTGPEQTKAAISGGLEAGSDRLRESERIAAQLQSRKEDRQAQERISALNRNSRERTEARNRKTTLFAGIGKVGTQILFAPFGASTSKAGTTTFKTGAGTIISGIKSLFT